MKRIRLTLDLEIRDKADADAMLTNLVEALDDAETSWEAAGSDEGATNARRLSTAVQQADVICDGLPVDTDDWTFEHSQIPVFGRER